MRAVAALLLLSLLLTACTKAPQPYEPPPAAAVVDEPSPAPAPAPPPMPVPEPPKPPSITVTPAQVLQGDVATLLFDRPVDGPVSLTVEGLNEQPKVYDLHGKPAAFIGVPAAAKVGTYPVKVTWADGSLDTSLEVIHKVFTEDRLVVTEAQEAVYYDPRQADEWRRVYASRSQPLDWPQWDGPFDAPLVGELEITTYFGEIRVVNGTETGRHSGMDFGAPTGTPIYAPAKGRVVFAEKLIVSGNTIIIDHGYNLFTAYYHCDAIGVAAGDWIERGGEIGTVGNTGFSTGPHLHWTATIGNTPVNPWPLTEAAPLGWRVTGPEAEQ